MRVAGEERLIAAEDAGLFRDALGVMPPGGLPEAFLEPVPDALVVLLARFARSRGPFTTAEAAARYAPRAGASPRSLLAGSSGPTGSCAASSAPAGSSASGAIPTCSGGCAARRSRHCARRWSPPSRRPSGGSSPPGTGSTGGRRLREALVPLQGLPLPVSLWESEVLRRRVPGYQPAWLDALCATGEVVWVGAGLDRVALYFRCRRPAARRARGRARARRRGGRGPAARARPVGRVLARPARGDRARRRRRRCPALWELVWAGEVTNDAWTPLRAARRYGTPVADRRPRRFARTRAAGTTSTQGRWSLTSRLFPAAVDRRALAELLLERQGIVVRDGVRGEGIAGGYGAVYGELRALETIGSCRRGYFVEGLGGAQFALPGAVERLRELRSGAEDDALVLAAADPAQPYGAALPWPRRAGARAARVAGAHVVLLGGAAALYVERGGRTLVPLREPDEAWLRPALAALADWVREGHAKRLAVERFDGRPVAETEAMPLLVEAGFLAGPRRAVLTALTATVACSDRHEQAEHDAEQQVAKGGLREGTARARHRRQLGGAARRVEAVGEQRQRVGDEVLDHRECDREPERIATDPLEEGPEDEPGNGAVDDVHPQPAARQCGPRVTNLPRIAMSE